MSDPNFTSIEDFEAVMTAAAKMKEQGGEFRAEATARNQDIVAGEGKIHNDDFSREFRKVYFANNAKIKDAADKLADVAKAMGDKVDIAANAYMATELANAANLGAMLLDASQKKDTK